jgi:hypothetical protein
MSIEEKVSITISISKIYRDRLRTMAAQQNLHDPDQLTSASTIAREIICEYIDGFECLEAGFQSIDHAADPSKESARNGSAESATDK